MFYLRQPSPARIEAVLAAARGLPFSYPEVGATRSLTPAGYPTNHHRLRLGTGRSRFRAAVHALRGWAMYRLPWTALHPPGAPVEAGTTVATVIHHLGFWSVNPCRVVYVEEGEAGGVARFSFALGTVAGHAERGEERFTLEWRREDDAVSFEIFAFAAAEHPLAWLGYPYTRLLQGRFGRQALEAVRRAAEQGPHA
ncbi:MAG TPA: DUF1990 domain-containing protein [Longimicrobiaceae bacterium]|nr:DUF1990 domain-containing protein [Longimicrobiaceae bacterium]